MQVRTVACGPRHALAVTTNERVYMWGDPAALSPDLMHSAAPVEPWTAEDEDEAGPGGWHVDAAASAASTGGNEGRAREEGQEGGSHIVFLTGAGEWRRI